MPCRFLQTNHHISKTGDLYDTSADLWKTLRIWSERVKNAPTLLSRTRFGLMTTASAPEGSVAAMLRPASNGPAGRVAAAAEQLTKAAKASQNKELKAGFEAFTSLAPEMQHSLLSAIDVFDNSVHLHELETVIEDRLKMIGPRGKAFAAREHLEGWWWGKIEGAS